MRKRKEDIDSLLAEIMVGKRAQTHDKEKAYREFKAQTGIEDMPRTPSMRRCLSPVLCKAAVCAMLVITLHFAYSSGHNSIQDRFADITVCTPTGSNTQLDLPDGTKVWLNASSRISYSQGFGIDDRSISLSGEGYFEVAHNEELPFTVEGSGLTVKVLGTKFDFQNYEGNANATVTLIEGRVSLSDASGKDLGTLAPNQKAVYDKATGNLVKSSTDAKIARRWTEGILIFDDMNLGEIAGILSHSYNVKILIEDEELIMKRFNGTFIRREQNLKDILEALAFTGKIEYDYKDNNTIVLF